MSRTIFERQSIVRIERLLFKSALNDYRPVFHEEFAFCHDMTQIQALIKEAKIGVHACLEASFTL